MSLDLFDVLSIEDWDEDEENPKEESDWIGWGDNEDAW